MTIPATARTTRSNRSTRSAVWLPFALIALVVVPAVFGSLRLIELAGGPQLMPANPRCPLSSNSDLRSSASANSPPT